MFRLRGFKGDHQREVPDVLHCRHEQCTRTFDAEIHRRRHESQPHASIGDIDPLATTSKLLASGESPTFATSLPSFEDDYILHDSCEEHLRNRSPDHAIPLEKETSLEGVDNIQDNSQAQNPCNENQDSMEEDGCIDGESSLRDWNKSSGLLSEHGAESKSLCHSVFNFYSAFDDF